jgi:hypothetical protein
MTGAIDMNTNEITNVSTVGGIGLLVDGKLDKSGGQMTGTIDMNTNEITNVSTVGGIGLLVDGKLDKSGGVMSGSIDMGNTNLSNAKYIVANLGVQTPEVVSAGAALDLKLGASSKLTIGASDTESKQTFKVSANNYSNQIVMTDTNNTTQADAIGFISIDGSIEGTSMIMGAVGTPGEVQIASYSNVNDLVLKTNNSFVGKEVRLKVNGNFEIPDGKLDMKTNEIIDTSKVSSTGTLTLDATGDTIISRGGVPKMTFADTFTTVGVSLNMNQNDINDLGNLDSKDDPWFIKSVGTTVMEVKNDELKVLQPINVKDLSIIDAGAVEVGIAVISTTVNTETTEIVPVGAAFAKVRAWGGGGQGGGGGAAGGGGAFTESYFAVSPGDSIKYYVGQGGDKDLNTGTVAEGGLVFGNHIGAGGGGTVIALSTGGNYDIKAVSGGGGGGGFGTSKSGGYGGQPGAPAQNPAVPPAGGGDNGVGGVGGGALISEAGDPGENMTASEAIFANFNGRGGNTFNGGDGAGSGGGGYGGGGAGSGVGNDAGGGGGSFGDTIINGNSGTTTGGAGAGKDELTEDGLPFNIGDGEENKIIGIGGAVSIRYFGATGVLLINTDTIIDGALISETVNSDLGMTGFNDFFNGGVSVGYNFYRMTTTQTVGNTTAETTLYNDMSSLGTRTIPANVAMSGATFNAHLCGILDTSGNTILTIRAKIGATTIADSGPIAINGNSNDQWEITMSFTIRTIGVGGTVIGNGSFKHNTGVGNLTMASPIALNTTIDNTIDFTAQWATLNVLNTISTQVAYINN